MDSGFDHVESLIAVAWSYRSYQSTLAELYSFCRSELAPSIVGCVADKPKSIEFLFGILCCWSFDQNSTESPGSID